jgi:hypothetical protein
MFNQNYYSDPFNVEVMYVTNTIYGNIDGVRYYIYASRSKNGIKPLLRHCQQRARCAAPVFKKMF